MIPRFSRGGDCWTRTSDLLRVKIRWEAESVGIQRFPPLLHTFGSAGRPLCPPRTARSFPRLGHGLGLAIWRRKNDHAVIKEYAVASSFALTVSWATPCMSPYSPSPRSHLVAYALHHIFFISIEHCVPTIEHSRTYRSPVLLPPHGSWIRHRNQNGYVHGLMDFTGLCAVFSQKAACIKHPPIRPTIRMCKLKVVLFLYVTWTKRKVCENVLPLKYYPLS